MNGHGSARRDGVATSVVGEMQGSPLLMSVPDAAHQLGIGKTLLWAMVRSGVVPTVRLGRRVLVPRQGLEDAVALWCQHPPLVLEAD